MLAPLSATTRLAARSKRRFARKLAETARAPGEGEISKAEAALRVESLVAFTRHAAARGFRTKVLEALQ